MQKITKRITASSLAIIAGTLLAQGAFATTTSFGAEDGPTAFTVDATHSYAKTLNFTLSGFVPGTDTITDAKLVITLSDDRGDERILYSFDGNAFTQNNVGRGPLNFTFDFVSLGIVDTLDDGKLAMTLGVGERGHSEDHDSYFYNGAVLSGHWTDGAQVLAFTSLLPTGVPVPVPATIGLMGVALAGVAAARRRGK